VLGVFGGPDYCFCPGRSLFSILFSLARFLVFSIRGFKASWRVKVVLLLLNYCDCFPDCMGSHPRPLVCPATGSEVAEALVFFFFLGPPTWTLNVAFRPSFSLLATIRSTYGLSPVFHRSIFFLRFRWPLFSPPPGRRTVFPSGTFLFFFFFYSEWFRASPCPL